MLDFPLTRGTIVKERSFAQDPGPGQLSKGRRPGSGEPACPPGTNEGEPLWVTACPPPDAAAKKNGESREARAEAPAVMILWQF